MQERKKAVLSYFDNLCLLTIGVLFVLFPIFFFSATTDAFVEPKQIVLVILSTIAILLFGIKSIISGRLSLRTSPFDIPVILLILITFISSIFSTNRYDALIAFVPFLYVGFIYLVVVNTAKTQKQLLFLLASLTAGAVLASLLTIFSFFNIFPLPFSYTHSSFFTAFGSLLDQALYYAIVLPIAGYFGYGFINTMNTKKPESTPFATGEAQNHRKKSSSTMAGFGVAFIIIAIGLGLTVYLLFTSQKPLILPFSTGLQIGFAAISQSNNVFKSLLLGSGFGTFLNDFTQFKPASYNADEALWAFTFFRSSSFVLELLATTGILGVAVFGYLIFRILKEKNFFLPLMIALLASLVLPFSFTILALLFFLLALFAVVCIQNNPHKFGEAEFSFAALARGFLGKETAHEHQHIDEYRPAKGFGKVLPSIFLIFILVFAASPLYFVARFIYSDLTFQQSLIAESQNNGLATYQLQTAAITLFPYRDIYYRSFSQTNLALANALATNQPKGASPSAQVQKDILTLIQQSINAGRAAVTVAPDTSFDWNNLSSIYRSLIGFGQNADQFTILTLNQAIALDPNNPQQYIDLGGVYYQLAKYDDAIREFQIAINLKQDYANAYYNLGHAYEQKGDYQDAMTNFQMVKQLVSTSANNTKIIDNDIATLTNIESAPKTGAAQPVPQQQASSSAKSNAVPQNVQEPITVDKPNTPPLPTRNPEETIPGPSVAQPNEPSPTSGQ
jgi:tetratricopeptide (TPR) repeat protein